MTDRLTLALQFPCPRCQAPIGHPCVSGTGVSHAGFVHSPRTKMLKQPRTFEQAEALGMQRGVDSATTTLRNAERVLELAETAKDATSIDLARKAVQQAEAWLVEAQVAAKARKRESNRRAGS